MAGSEWYGILAPTLKTLHDLLRGRLVELRHGHSDAVEKEQDNEIDIPSRPFPRFSVGCRCRPGSVVGVGRCSFCGSPFLLLLSPLFLIHSLRRPVDPEHPPMLTQPGIRGVDPLHLLFGFGPSARIGVEPVRMGCQSQTPVRAPHIIERRIGTQTEKVQVPMELFYVLLGDHSVTC